MSLIPVIVKTPFVIPKSMDEVEREKKTLKELRELAKEIDVDIFGPKGGMIAKKPLLERLKIYFDDIEEERLSEIRTKKEIIREHNEELIKFKEARIVLLSKEVKELRSEEQKFRVLCDKKEAEIEELRAVIRSLI